MSYHLVGIGGVGMSALAQALLDAGTRVSGSDRLVDAGDATAVLDRLRTQGVAIHPQDGSGVDGRTARIVVSTAIEGDNPDRRAAERLGVPVVHRAAQLAEVVAGRTLIAVTGTCGKSTVTALVGWILAEAGWDPLVVNGAVVVGWDAAPRVGSVRPGRGRWAVLEADESDKSLTVFKPDHAIVTNLDADHFGIDETRRLFDAFRAGVRGVVVDGTQPGADGPEGFAAQGWGVAFTLDGRRYSVPLPGRHNAANARQAATLALRLGVPAPAVAAGLASFRGVSRRLERVGACNGATVVDDYAHNPAKLAAAWSTLAAAFPRVAGVWRPHGYGPLRNMLDALARAFGTVVRPGDRLLLLPVYDAGGSADRSIRSDDLAARLQAQGVPATVVPDLAAAEACLRAEAAPGTVLATFGARDPGLPRLARRLAGDAAGGPPGASERLPR